MRNASSKESEGRAMGEFAMGEFGPAELTAFRGNKIIPGTAPTPSTKRHEIPGSAFPAAARSNSVPKL